MEFLNKKTHAKICQNDHSRNEQSFIVGFYDYIKCNQRILQMQKMQAVQSEEQNLLPKKMQGIGMILHLLFCL